MTDIEAYLEKAAMLYWADRMVQVQSDLNTVQNRAGATGMGHSSGLMQQLQEACEHGLDDFLTAYLDSVRKALEAFRPKANRRLKPVLEAPFSAKLAAVCSALDERLAHQAELIGFPNKWRLATCQDSLLEKAANELDPIVASHAGFMRSVHKPWYDRPLGRLAITALGGVLAAIGFALIKSVLKW